MVERIWHNHNKWEDYHAGLYDSGNNREEMVKSSYDLLSSPYRLFVEMVRVSIEWPHCAEFNLSNQSANRRAWLGWSSCCYHHGATDEETRKAWNMLNKEQKEKANGVATVVINTWEQNYYGGDSA